MSGTQKRKGIVLSIAVHWIALALLFFLTVMVPLAAGWLNSATYFAFPLGTFVTGLLVPFGLVVLVFWFSRNRESKE